MKIGTVILIIAIGLLLLVVEIESRSQAAKQRRNQNKKLKRQEAKKQNGGAKDGAHVHQHPDKNANPENDDKRMMKRLDELQGNSEASKSAGTKEAKHGGPHPDPKENDKRMMERLEALQGGDSPSSGGKGKKDAKHGAPNHPGKKGDSPTSGSKKTKDSKHPKKGQHPGKESDGNGQQEGDSPASGSGGANDPKHPDKKGGHHPEKKGDGKGDSPASGNGGGGAHHKDKKDKHKKDNEHDAGIKSRLDELQGDKPEGASEGKHPGEHPGKRTATIEGYGLCPLPQISVHFMKVTVKQKVNGKEKVIFHHLKTYRGKAATRHHVEQAPKEGVMDRTVRRRKKRSVVGAQESFAVNPYQQLGNGYQDQITRIKRRSKKKKKGGGESEKPKSSGESQKPTNSGGHHADIFVLGTAVLEGDQPVTVIIEPNFKGRKMRNVRKKCWHKITKVFHPHHDIKQRYRKGESGKREKREVFNLGECNFEVPPNGEQCKGGTQVKKT
ncbi:hypothetical protein Ddc_12108 [Ditylenchus destructor]|nr:hypothetical protein Ddc_12108 [Ditylenchus destructor]